MQFLSYLINGISLGECVRADRIGVYHGLWYCQNAELRPWRCHHDWQLCDLFAFGSFGLNPIVSVLLSMVVCTILGVTMERVAYRPCAKPRPWLF